mgnify:CR=1 FL=1
MKLGIKYKQLEHLYELLYLNPEDVDPLELLYMIVEEIEDDEFDDIYSVICNTYNIKPIKEEE